MKKIFALACLLALLAAPSLAQDPLPPPHVVAIVAADYSEYSPETGWCIMVQWELVPGADFYLVRVYGKNGKAPVPADGSPPGKASWKLTDSYGASSSTDVGDVPICGLAEKQKVKFRLQAIDYDNFANQFGEKTAPFTVKLRKYGKAPVLPRFGVPAVEVFGSQS
ncbi:MAG: hypothetical protein OXE95_04365 [Chloroflexi bacterium]|nr:hypothetical protein [Chloroflexota bacterium]MCY4246797.1 hypothetical protein [Chloroflexota bacterium]